MSIDNQTALAVAQMNDNLEQLIQKYDSSFTRLADSGEQIKSELQTIIDGGKVAEADNALKLGGKSLEQLNGRTIHHTAYKRISTSSNEYIHALDIDVDDFDTDKYDYFIDFICSVCTGNNGVNGGASLQIRINDNVIVSSGHRGHNMNNGAYYTNILRSPLITSGFSRAKRNISAHFAAYDSGKSVHNHDNGGAHSTGKTTEDKMTLTIFEIPKGVN